MDTDTLKDRIINGALSDIFQIPAVRTPAILTPANEEPDAAETTTSDDIRRHEITPAMQIPMQTRPSTPEKNKTYVSY
jgi:hypothetical protein